MQIALVAYWHKKVPKLLKLKIIRKTENKKIKDNSQY